MLRRLLTQYLMAGAFLPGVMLTPNWQAAPPFHVSEVEQGAEVASARDLGSRIVRLCVEWEDRNNPAYVARLDTYVAQIYAAHMNLLLCVMGSKLTPPPEGEWGMWVSQVTSRYHPYALEVWNEVNTRNFFTGTPYEYARMIREAAQFVQSGTRIIAGATYGGDAQYVRMLIRAGMSGYDAISFHPYSLSDHWINPNKRRSPFQRAIRHMRKLHVPLWITEAGFSTCPANPCVSAHKQARWLADSMRIAREAGIKVFTTFSLRDIGPYVPQWDLNAGLLTRDFIPKQSYTTLRKVMHHAQ